MTIAERLRIEARIAAKLVHPSIVRVLDIGESEAGEPFIVMELLEGESLAQLLERGRLSSFEIVRLLLPIAEALALAHGAGVVHRDLKPDNVFVVTNQRTMLPKLLDFGIAKIEAVDGRCRRSLTQAGTLLGSPDYMSPEQIACMPDVDHRSDIWSFCVILYEALSGQAPFSGDTFRTLCHSVSCETPPPLELFGVDPQLAAIVRQGLAKDRAQRPASIAELGRSLARWLADQGVGDDAAGSSLSAKWLHGEYFVPGEPLATEPLSSAQERANTTVVSEVHEPRLQRQWHWPTLLGALTAVAAIVALVLGTIFQARGLASSAPASTAPPGSLEQPEVCRAPAPPVLAAAVFSSGPEISSPAAATTAPTSTTPPKISRASLTSGTRPTRTPHGRLPF